MSNIPDFSHLASKGDPDTAFSSGWSYNNSGGFEILYLDLEPAMYTQFANLYPDRAYNDLSQYGFGSVLTHKGSFTAVCGMPIAKENFSKIPNTELFLLLFKETSVYPYYAVIGYYEIPIVSGELVGQSPGSDLRVSFVVNTTGIGLDRVIGWDTINDPNPPRDFGSYSYPRLIVLDSYNYNNYCVRWSRFTNSIFYV